MKLKLFNRTVDIDTALILEDFKHPGDTGYIIPTPDIRFTRNVDFIVKGILELFAVSDFEDQEYLKKVDTLNDGLGHKYIELDNYEYASLEPKYMPTKFKYKLTDSTVIYMTERDGVIQYLIKNNEDDYFLITDDEDMRYPTIYYMGYAFSSNQLKVIKNLMESEYGGH